MKIKPYVEKLNSSSVYKDFQKKYGDAFMIAGFFILDLETGDNLHQIDYYVPSEKKIAAFTLDKGVTVQMLEMMNNRLVPEKLDIKTNIDLDALHGILEDEMKNRSITEDIKKIIAILQTIDGKKIWNLNCVLSGMGILKAHIDDESKTVLKMEKASILDYVKRMPASLAALKGMGEANGPESEKQIKEKISTLSKLEKEIEAEKQKAQKELTKKSKSKKSKPDKTEDKEDKEETENIEEEN